MQGLPFDFTIFQELDLRRLTIESCLKAEEVPATFDRYMERLLQLRKLVFKSFDNAEDQKFVNDIIVRYLVGNLRINLRPMWSPVMDIIKTHANEKNGKEFWSVFKDSFFAAFETTGKISLKQPAVKSRKKLTERAKRY